MSTYDSFEDYNADVTAAREAYAADEQVRVGMCETGCGRKRDTGAGCRKCWACRHQKAAVASRNLKAARRGGAA